MNMDLLRRHRLAAVLAIVLLVLLGAGGVVAAARRTGDGGSGPAAGAAGVAEFGPASAGSSSPSASVSASTGPRPSSGAAAPPARISAKKGVSVWAFPGLAAALTDVRASWYYNWAPARGNAAGPSTVEFVPMIWGAASVTDANLATVKREGRVLLGFNEPDFADQANMSVEQALDLWPRLMGTGMRLGSPAVAFGGADAGGWLDRFMSGARTRGHRVDFIMLHWYGSDFRAEAAVGHLRGYLQAVWNRYRLPIWLTEYALISFSGGTRYPTGEQQAAFVRGSTAMLQSLPYVERYAWFALPATGDAGTGLYRDGTTPTPAGAAYRAAA